MMPPTNRLGGALQIASQVVGVATGMQTFAAGGGIAGMFGK
jgi:hypothetical protein